MVLKKLDTRPNIENDKSLYKLIWELLPWPILSEKVSVYEIYIYITYRMYELFKFIKLSNLIRN